MILFDTIHTFQINHTQIYQHMQSFCFLPMKHDSKCFSEVHNVSEAKKKIQQLTSRVMGSSLKERHMSLVCCLLAAWATPFLVVWVIETLHVMPSKFRLLDLWRGFAHTALRLDNRGKERLDDDSKSLLSLVDTGNEKAFKLTLSTLDCPAENL